MPVGVVLSFTCVLIVQQIKINQALLWTVKVVQPILSFNWKTAVFGNDINKGIKHFCHKLLCSCITIQTVLIILYPILPEGVTSKAKQGRAWLR